MQFAQREPVSHRRRSRFAVWHDMGCVEELLVSKTAKSTSGTVGAKHAFTKRALMQADLQFARGVLASLVDTGVMTRAQRQCRYVTIQNRNMVALNGESQCAGIIPHHEHRPRGKVAPR